MQIEEISIHIWTIVTDSIGFQSRTKEKKIDIFIGVLP